MNILDFKKKILNKNINFIIRKKNKIEVFAKLIIIIDLNKNRFSLEREKLESKEYKDNKNIEIDDYMKFINVYDKNGNILTDNFVISMDLKGRDTVWTWTSFILYFLWLNVRDII